ncbi:MAG: NAD(P)/FAD-dependent oxidoreductase [Leptolinea sp.]
MNDNSVIIIGGGVAGLAAGVYGQMNGYKTSIFEMHSLPGGLCTAWQRKGFTFDGCIHWLIGSNPKSDSHILWEELGALKDATIVNHEQYMSFQAADGKTFHVYNNVDRLERHMLELAPIDTPLIKEFCSALRKLTGIEMPLEQPKGLIGQIKSIGKLLPAAPIYLKYRKTSMDEFSARFKDPFLRSAWQALFDLPDFPLFASMMALAAMCNQDAGYPIGGSLEFSKSIEKRYKELGGTLHYNARVEKVLIDDGQAVGIRLTDGKEFRANRVISAADGFATLNHMLEGKFTSAAVQKIYDEGEIFQPLVMVSIGVNRDLSDQPQTLVHMLNKPIMIAGKEEKALGIKHFCYDPTMAPAGKSVAMVMYSTTYDYWKKLAEEPERYEAEKKQTALTIISAIEHYLPGFEKDVAVVDVATPLTTERFTGNWQGSFEGWRITTKNMTQAFTGGMPHTLPGLKNFYMVGQWVEPGGGLPTSGLSGRGIFKRICKEDKKEFVTTRT